MRVPQEIINEVVADMLNPPPSVSIEAERDILRHQSVVTVSLRLDDELAHRADEREFEAMIVEGLAMARMLIMARYRLGRDL